MSTSHMAMIVGFMLLMVLVGIVSAKKAKTSEDWSIAGRSLGLLPMAGTYFATIISSGSLIGNVGYFYGIGWSGLWYYAGTATTSVLAAVFYAAKLRRIGKVTLPDYLEERFGKLQSLLSSLLILFSTIFLTCAQIIGAANLVMSVSGWSMTACIIVSSVFLICFTMFGGMLSVAWTDTLCTVIMIGGLWIATAYLVWGKIGGLHALNDALRNTDPSLLDPFAGGEMSMAMILSWIFTWGFGNFGAPHFITRFYCAKDEHTASKSQICVLGMLAAFAIPLMLFSLSGRVLCPGITVEDQVSPTMIRDLLPTGLGGVMMASIFAACISTADSVLLLASTTVTNDLYHKYIDKNASSGKLLCVSRVATIGVGLAATLAALYGNSTVFWIQTSAITLMGSAISASILIGLIWKRANWQGGLASCVLGFATCVLWYVLDQPFGLMPIIPAMITGSLSMVVVSLLTAPPTQDVTNHFFS